MAYKPMNELHEFQFYCQKILPLVYDESLSYYEVLGKLTKKVNDIIEQVNVIEDNVTFLNSEVVDLKRRMTQLEHDMVELRQDFEEFKTLLEQRFSDLETELKTTLRTEIDRIELELTQRINNLEIQILQRISKLESDIEQQFRTLETQIDNKFTAQDEHIDREISSIRRELRSALSSLELRFDAFRESVDSTLLDYLDRIEDAVFRSNRYTDDVAEALQAQIDEIKYDPTPRIDTPADHVIRRTQDAFDVEHCYLRSWAMTAGELDTCSLKCSDYEKLNMNVYQFDYLNKWYIEAERTRRQNQIALMIQMMRDLCRCGLMAWEYDDKVWTAEDYDLQNLTALQYDLFGCCNAAGGDVWELAYNDETEGLSLVHISGSGTTRYEFVYSAENESLTFQQVA